MTRLPDDLTPEEARAVAERMAKAMDGMLLLQGLPPSVAFAQVTITMNNILRGVRGQRPKSALRLVAG